MGAFLVPFLFAAVHVVAGPSFHATASGAPTPDVASAARVAADERALEASLLLDGANRERIAHGVAPLRFDSRLCAIARAHALDMAARRYFEHTNPEGATPFDRMDRAHYAFGYAGENLARDVDASAADRHLWQSVEHRKNTLDAHYARIGVAAVRTADGEIFVEDFSD